MSVAVALVPITGIFFGWECFSTQVHCLNWSGRNTATTFSLSIRSTMFWIDFDGCARSSRTTSSHLRFKIPPAALTSSSAACSPRTAPWPPCAEGEAEMSPFQPSLIVCEYAPSETALRTNVKRSFLAKLAKIIYRPQ